jgi:tRNA A-37 threonylcarbamoyl transferase component Bud32
MSEGDAGRRFEIVRLIGRGAMGAVHLAEDTVIGRRVALKTVNLDALQDQPVAERRPRLGEEARTAGRLSHPNIVAIHDVLEEGDGRSLSIAMEYVEGTNVAELLRSGPAPTLEKALDIAAQTADGLAYAHAQGVVHRDIKPENLLLAADGRVKIADFGIAHLIDDALAEDLRFFGTPSYMAPERIRGEEVDHRSDLFSLGVVLYELLTRRLPFEGDTVAAVTRRIVGEESTPLERYFPDAPAPVVAIVRKALEKDPQRRYGAAADLAADLRRALAARGKLRQTQPVPAETGSPEPGPTQLLPEIDLPPLPPRPAAATPRVAPGPPARRLPAQLWQVTRGLPGRVWAAARRMPARGRAAVAGGALVLLAAAVWGLLRPEAREEPAPVAETPAPAHVTALLAGLDRLRQGDPEGAEAYLRSAGLLAPESQRTALLRELAARQLAMTRRAEQELVIHDHLARARAELVAGRTRAVREALAAARALEPERPEVAELERALAGRRAAPAVPAPAPIAAPPAPTAVASAEAPPILELETPVETHTAQLLIDFQSEIPRGALTLYSGDRQIFREGFHFVEKTRFLITRGVAGSFSRTLEHAAGNLDLRVYLSLPRLSTQVVRVDGHLKGGTTRVLRVRVAADGGFTARLQ